MSHVSGERFRSFSLGILRTRRPIFKIPGRETHDDWENDGGSYFGLTRLVSGRYHRSLIGQQCRHIALLHRSWAATASPYLVELRTRLGILIEISVNVEPSLAAEICALIWANSPRARNKPKPNASVNFPVVK